MTGVLTCLSCAHHRQDGCTERMPHWPTERLTWCVVAQYLPGSDEPEDWPTSHQDAQDGARGAGALGWDTPAAPTPLRGAQTA